MGVRGVGLGSIDVEFLVSLGYALRSSTRRRILEVLGVEGSLSVSELARRVGISVPSLTAHIRVLRECGLVEEIARIGVFRKVLRLAVPVFTSGEYQEFSKRFSSCVEECVRKIVTEVIELGAGSALPLLLPLVMEVTGRELGIRVTLIVSGEASSLPRCTG